MLEALQARNFLTTESNDILRYLEYHELIENDIKILKQLYSLDLSDKKVKMEDESTTKDKLYSILKEAYLLCNSILLDPQKEFEMSCLAPEKRNQILFEELEDPYPLGFLLKYVCLEALFDIEKTQHTNRVSFSKFIELSLGEVDLSDALKKYRKYFVKNPLNCFLDIMEKYGDSDENSSKKSVENRASFSVSTFLAPLFARFVMLSSSELYYKFENVELQEQKEYRYKSLVLYLKNFYNYNIAHLTEGYRFYDPEDEKLTDKQEVECLDILCYFVLGGIYDIDNMIYLAKKLTKIQSPLSKEYIAKVMFQIILVPDEFNKKRLIDYYFDKITLKNVEDLFYGFGYTSRYDYENQDIAGKQSKELINCNQHMKFLSYVYYPMLSRIFNILYFNTYSSATLLKEYLQESKTLSSYANKINNAISMLTSNDENDYLLPKEKAMLLLLYEYIGKYIFNSDLTPALKLLTSIDYSYRNSPFIDSAVKAVIDKRISKESIDISAPFEEFQFLTPKKCGFYI